MSYLDNNGTTLASTESNGTHYPQVKLVIGATTAVSETNPFPVGLCGAWTTYQQLTNLGFASLKTTICGITGGDPMPIHGISGATAIDVRIIRGDGSTPDMTVDLIGGRTGELGIKTRYLTSNFVGPSNHISNIDSVRIQGVVGGGSVAIHPDAGFSFGVNIIGSDGNTSGNVGIFGISGAEAVGITAINFHIRGITSASDSITVVGQSINGIVPIGIYGFTGNTMEKIHSTNNAVWVNIQNGVTANVSATELDIRTLDYTTDDIRVHGIGPDTSILGSGNLSTVPTINSIVTKDTTLLPLGGITGAGWSGAAMNVNFVGAQGITFELCASATFGAEIGITQPQSSPVPVHGSTFASSAIWVAGGTGGQAVVVVGNSGGFLPVELSSTTLLTSEAFNQKLDITNSTLLGIKTGTEHAFAIKSALYGTNNTNSLYKIIEDGVSVPLTVLKSTVIGTQSPSISVSVSHTQQQTMFTASTGFAGYTAKSLDQFITGATGLTCENGVTIKAYRTGAVANEFLSIISESDITDAADDLDIRNLSSYPLYHGEEILIKVDNINKISVFYAASSVFAPNNSGSGMTFSFLA